MSNYNYRIDPVARVSKFLLACLVMPLPAMATAVLLTVLAPISEAREVKLEYGDLTLNANLEIVEGGGVEDGIILLLHGTLGHKDMEIISTLQDVFGEYEYNTLAINLSLNVDDRHGFYPCERAHTHKNSDAVTELQAWMEWLRTQGANDVVLFGHSRGANQIANYMLQYRHDSSAVILLAPPTGAPVINDEDTRRLHSASQTDWLSKTDFLHCKNARVRGDSFHSYYDVDRWSDTLNILEELTSAVLVLSGNEDSVVPKLAERMKKVSNPNVTHIEIDGAGHFFRDLYAYDVVEASGEFLRALRQ